jgi:hypothetical protein
MVARLACGIAALATTIVIWPVAASAAPSDPGPGLVLHTMQKSYGQDESIRLVFVVTNASDQACGLAETPDGSVQVTSVRRDGQELTPLLGRSFYEDGLDSAVRKGLVKAAPGSTVDLTLTSFGTAGGNVLRSVTRGPDGGSLDALWPVGEKGRYEVTAAYAVPTVDGPLAPCAGAAGERTVEFTVGDAGLSGTPWLWVAIAGAGLLLLAVIVVVVVLLRRGRRTPAAAAVVLLAVAGLTVAVGRPAHADVVVDPTKGVPIPGDDFAGEVAGCMKKFEAPGGDPAGLLPRLKDPKTPKVTIVPTPGGSNTFETPDVGGPGKTKGSSTITWNPTSTDPYEGDVARDPCAALYHELNHANDVSTNTVPAGDCGDTGIKTAEVKATFAENKYRKGQGLGPRTKYDGKDLPRSLDDCKKPPKKTPPPKGPVKLCENSNQCGSTNGDPHLVTFDRAYYDFQAVGEFVVARSTGSADDPLEVQARQIPLGQSKTVSVNSAVAFKIGSSIVDITLAGGVTRVHIDHQVADLARARRSLPGGGSVERRESDLGKVDGYEVRWPDGSEAAVDQIGSYGYRLLIKLAQSRAGKVQGLLGNFDGDPGNDIAPPGGAAMAQPVPFEKLYPSYADSWRVTGSTSLFSYDAGQTTDTFTDRAYPHKPVTVDTLDAAQRAQAETICRWAGVVDAWQFLECVLDVGVTGRSEFAVNSSISEVVAPPVLAPIAAPPIAAGTLTGGGTDRVSFTGHRGDVVFVDAVAPAMESACSPYRLVDPSGDSIASGCNISGSGYIDRTELPTDGEYAVIIDPRSSVTGRATVRVYLSKDVTGRLDPNGAPETATIVQPGAVARYEFNGVQGQRVFVDVPTSTLPDQCSPLKLYAPSGTLLESGCVIGSSGDIEGLVLPADGPYSVVIDPVNRTIGTSEIRLYAAKDAVATIAVNGPPVVATIGQPGAASRFTFTATAGATVSVDATNSTLPNQCSPLKLVDPVGRELRNGCVINGIGGLASTALPDSGAYAVVVDPSGDATGAVTLTLRG